MEWHSTPIGEPTGNIDQDHPERITGIIIPAQEREPLVAHRIPISNAAEYRRIVGGDLEIVSFENPSASLYVNEDGKRDGLALNGRATILMWAHQRALRFYDVIAGDALLVGPADDANKDTDAPETYVRILLEAHRFRADVQVHGDPGWYGNELRFDRWTDAYDHVLKLAHRWTAVCDVRVVPDE